MSTYYTMNVNSSDYYLVVKVGPVDDDGNLKFGQDAEVHASNSYGQDVAKVNFASIGSHDTDTANERIRSYQLAVKITDLINHFIADGQDLGSIGVALDSEQIQTDILTS